MISISGISKVGRRKMENGDRKQEVRGRLKKKMQYDMISVVEKLRTRQKMSAYCIALKK